MDSQGNSYVTGYTDSADFPLLNPYDSTLGGFQDAFLLSFSPNGTMRWSTFFGGTGDEVGTFVEVDANGNLYVVGHTYSTDLPTMNAFNSTYGGDKDGFVASFTSDGQPILEGMIRMTSPVFLLIQQTTST